MPVKNQPQTLKQISLGAVHSLLISSPNAVTSQDLQFVPSKVVDLVMANLVRSLCTMKTDYIPYLNNVIMAQNLTHVDLSPLKGLESDISCDDIERFKQYFESICNQLKYLVYLSLETNNSSATLPACDDNILRGIGKYCNKLQYLNINYNKCVTDTGLNCLMPESENEGCPDLSQLMISGCSVSSETVASLLLRLKKLRIVDYDKLGDALYILHETNIPSTIAALNMGISYLKFHPSESEIPGIHHMIPYVLACIATMCPHIQVLDANIVLEDVDVLTSFEKIDKLTLIIQHEVRAPREEPNYFAVRGAGLTSLKFTCISLDSEFIWFLGRNCPNLTELCITSFMYTCNDAFENGRDRDLILFPFMSKFSLVLASFTNPFTNISVDFLSLLLKSSKQLTRLCFIFQSNTLTDESFKRLFNSIDTSSLRDICIKAPGDNKRRNILSLTTASVRLIMRSCPKLKNLENLTGWSIDNDSVTSLLDSLRSDCSVTIASL